MKALHRVPKKGLKTTEMLGKPVADLSLASTGGTTFHLYFYPKENTSGCTAARVFGISRDSLASHERFKEKMRFPFELLSDPDEAVCRQFAVMKEKSMYGKKVRGIERSTFVVDAKGVLAREWRGVKVPGHAQEVLNFVKAL
jgi:peroxiredoxin Q/BCP